MLPKSFTCHFQTSQETIVHSVNNVISKLQLLYDSWEKLTEVTDDAFANLGTKSCWHTEHGVSLTISSAKKATAEMQKASPLNHISMGP